MRINVKDKPTVTEDNLKLYNFYKSDRENCLYYVTRIFQNNKITSNEIFIVTAMGSSNSCDNVMLNNREAVAKFLSDRDSIYIEVEINET